jgi:hypothetical protein
MLYSLHLDIFRNYVSLKTRVQQSFLHLQHTTDTNFHWKASAIVLPLLH